MTSDDYLHRGDTCGVGPLSQTGLWSEVQGRQQCENPWFADYGNSGFNDDSFVCAVRRQLEYEGVHTIGVDSVVKFRSGFNLFRNETQTRSEHGSSQVIVFARAVGGLYILSIVLTVMVVQ
jgi:hypothetical protein